MQGSVEGGRSKGGATIGGGGVMTPPLFQILVFLLYSLVLAQCIDPRPSPTLKFMTPLLGMSRGRPRASWLDNIN